MDHSRIYIFRVEVVYCSFSSNALHVVTTKSESHNHHDTCYQEKGFADGGVVCVAHTSVEFMTRERHSLNIDDDAGATTSCISIRTNVVFIV